jgi:hypothetical protein
MAGRSVPFALGIALPCVSQRLIGIAAPSERRLAMTKGVIIKSLSLRGAKRQSNIVVLKNGIATAAESRLAKTKKDKEG